MLGEILLTLYFYKLTDLKHLVNKTAIKEEFKIKKNRKQKADEYNQKYGHIPLEYRERLSWMCDYYNLPSKKMDEILTKRDNMMMNLYYTEIDIILYELPEGTPRPRFRLVTKKNVINEAMNNPNFVHVYSINAKEDSLYMKRLVGQELISIESLLCTPFILEYNTYFQTPSSYNVTDIFMSEIGIIRPVSKPDWDNIGKKYSDMSNCNIWLDDSFVIKGTVEKFYSILPRIEIKLKYLNSLYNRYQYNMISNRRDFEKYNCCVNFLNNGGNLNDSE